MFNSFNLGDLHLPPNLADLRAEVREFIAGELRAGSFQRNPDGWDVWDEDFSRKVGQRGWIGMTWPKQYGGQERTALERFVVSEELLMAGAPIRAHWLADRQFGPLLLSHGTEAQKQTYLPRIVAGEWFFCVGLSEPDSGSDLASIRTRAEKVEGGWRVDGRKVWTSYAHRAHVLTLFARTSPRTETGRHGGVSQFLVDLKNTRGMTVSPIYNLSGEHDFNEVVFDGALLPEDALIGAVDNGWTQISGELAYERSGPERWSNTYGLILGLLDEIGTDPARADAEQVGRLIAQIWTLHRMSFAIAGMLERGKTPDVEAALVKDLGNVFDQEVPVVARKLISEARRADSPRRAQFEAMLARAIYYAPSYTIRGGTKEILRGIVAKGLGLR